SVTDAPHEIRHHLAVPPAAPDEESLHVTNGESAGPSNGALLLSAPRNFAIVASPGLLIPSLVTTFFIVRSRIFRSIRKVRLSTYQTSSRSRSPQSSVFLPFTCAQPVIP